MKKSIAMMLLALLLGPAALAKPAPEAAPPEAAPEADSLPTPDQQAALAKLDHLDELIRRVDAQAQRAPNGHAWQLNLRGRQIMVVTDPKAGRMRIMTAIAPASALSPELMARLLVANFESALDARYAVGQDVLWGTYIHPLMDLTDDEFLAGIGQVFNIAATFGNSFSSGMMVYGGGASEQELERRRVIDELLKKGEEKPL
ncbi:MAG: hypothetical protein Tsb0016_01260 [Sphingomonadales bacterium]